jgi:hypothetical protein
MLVALNLKFSKVQKPEGDKVQVVVEAPVLAQALDQLVVQI